MPAPSPTMEWGTIVRWTKQEGDQLSEGDLLVEIETDKETMGLKAAEEGYLAKIVVPAGTKDVPLGKLLCTVVPNAADVAAFKNYTDDAAGEKPAPKPSAPAPFGAPAPSSYPSHTPVKLPSLSPTMKEGDVLTQIATDKATMDFETPEEGFLAKILTAAGSREVPIRAMLCIIVPKKEDIAAFKDYQPTVASAPSQPAVARESVAPSVGGKVPASPLSRVKAAKKGIDLSELSLCCHLVMHPQLPSGLQFTSSRRTELPSKFLSQKIFTSSGSKVETLKEEPLTSESDEESSAAPRRHRKLLTMTATRRLFHEHKCTPMSNRLSFGIHVPSRYIHSSACYSKNEKDNTPDEECVKSPFVSLSSVPPPLDQSDMIRLLQEEFRVFKEMSAQRDEEFRVFKEMSAQRDEEFRVFKEVMQVERDVEFCYQFFTDTCSLVRYLESLEVQYLKQTETICPVKFALHKEKAGGLNWKYYVSMNKENPRVWARWQEAE